MPSIDGIDRTTWPPPSFEDDRSRPHPGSFFSEDLGGDPLRLVCVGVWVWGSGPRLTSDGSEATWGV